MIQSGLALETFHISQKEKNCFFETSFHYEAVASLKPAMQTRLAYISQKHLTGMRQPPPPRVLELMACTTTPSSQIAFKKMFITICVYMGRQVAGKHAKVREEPTEVSSLPSCVSWESISGCQAWSKHLFP